MIQLDATLIGTVPKRDTRADAGIQISTHDNVDSEWSRDTESEETIPAQRPALSDNAIAT
jgi:hypothetical protein